MKRTALWNDEKIANLPIRFVKQLMDAGNERLMTVDLIKEILELNKYKVPAIAGELIRLGYLQKHPYLDDCWQLAVRGDILRTTPVGRLMNTQKLEDNRATIIARIDQVNYELPFAFTVNQFSMKEEKGDTPDTYKVLMVALALTPKETDPEKQKALEEERAQLTDRLIPNFYGYLDFARDEVANYIRKGLHNVLVSFPRVPAPSRGHAQSPFD